MHLELSHAIDLGIDHLDLRWRMEPLGPPQYLAGLLLTPEMAG